MSEKTDQSLLDGPQHLPLLRSTLITAPNRLAAIPFDLAAQKQSPGQWSRKEELGHLIDSAANNHQRIVRGQFEDSPAMPGYDGDAWVALHGYQTRDWQSLIELWRAGNLQLLAAAEAAPADAWPRTLTIGGSDLLTLRLYSMITSSTC